MRAQRTWLVGVAAALVVAAAGCGGATNTSGSGSAPPGASIAPKTAAVYASVNTDLGSGQWKAAQSLLDTFPGKDDLLQKVRQSFEKDTNVSWENDVKPALGPELDVVVLDLKDNTDAVGLVQPKDETAFTSLVAKVNAADPSNGIVAQDYQGWKIFSSTQAALTRFKAAAASGTLADDSTFTTAMGKLSDEALAKVYVDGSKLGDVAKKAAGSISGLIPAGGKLVSVVAELVAEDDGVRVSGTATSEGSEESKTYTASLVDKVPAGALAFVSFNGETVTARARKQLDDALSALAGRISGGQLFVPIVRQLGPIFAHESALYVRSGSPIPEVTLVTTPDSPSEAMSTADELISGLAMLTGKNVTPTTVTLGGVQAKSLPLGPVTIYYGVVGDNFVVTNQQEAFADLQASGNRLSDDPNYKEALNASGMPDQTGGFVYLDLKDSIPLVESLVQLGGQSVPPAVSNNVRPLRTLVAWAEPKGNDQSLTAFLELK